MSSNTDDDFTPEWARFEPKDRDAIFPEAVLELSLSARMVYVALKATDSEEYLYVEEIADRTGVSYTSARDGVLALKEEGYIEERPALTNAGRTFRLDESESDSEEETPVWERPKTGE